MTEEFEGNMAVAVEEQVREEKEIKIDVDLDTGMEWEVETEPAPESEPIREEPYRDDYYDPGVRVAKSYAGGYRYQEDLLFDYSGRYIY